MTQNRESYPTNKGRDLRQRRRAEKAQEAASDTKNVDEAETKDEEKSKAIERHVKRIDALSASARTSWLGLISYLAFIAITLLGVEDADFFISERQTSLPIVDVSVPTFLFFALAPFLGASLYTYFHLQLIRVWDALNEALDDTQANLTHHDIAAKISPWLVTEYALSRGGRIDADDRPLRPTARFMSRISTFWAGPSILFLFWLRSIPAKEELLTIVGCGVPFLLSIGVLTKSSQRLRASVDKEFSASAFREPLRRLRVGAVAVVVVVLSWLVTEGSFEFYAREVAEGLEGSDAAKDYISAGQLGDPPWQLRWADYLNAPDGKWWGEPLNGLVDVYTANLNEVDFVGATDKIGDYVEARMAFRLQWCRSQGVPASACGYTGLAQPPELREFVDRQRQRWCESSLGFEEGDSTQCRQRFETLDHTFDIAWLDHRRADIDALTDRDLGDRDLRGARLIGARLEGANLTETRLDDADLRKARLEGARLTEAWLRGTDLRRARMEGVNLRGARLGENTIFCPVTLRGAQLYDLDLFVAKRFNRLDPFVEAFGDKSVKLPDPDKYTAGEGQLSHWIGERLDWSVLINRTNFVRRAEEWQRDIGDERRTFAEVRDRVECPEIELVNAIED